MKPFHVGVAAEAFAAGLLAQAGCDVLVQYGANQPEYDLVAANVRDRIPGAWRFSESRLSELIGGQTAQQGDEGDER